MKNEHSIGKVIAKLRKEKGWTQLELAKKLNVSDKAVSKWESEAGFPEITQFPVLSNIFGVSIDYLMTGINQEPKVIIATAELCARKDDVSMFSRDFFNKDEKGKTIYDYIIEYDSVGLFEYLCKDGNSHFTKFKISDAIRLCLIANRLDLLKDKDFLVGYGRRFTFENEKEILTLLPEKVKNSFMQDDFKARVVCCLDDKLFKTIVCDKRISEDTISVLLSKQNGRECYWYHVIPYLIHESYKNNQTDMLTKLLEVATKNNNYAYENIDYKSYTISFYYLAPSYGTKGYGIVRILEETIKLALEKGDIDFASSCVEFNKAVNKYANFKAFIPTEYEVKMATLKSKNASGEILEEERYIYNGVIDVTAIAEKQDYLFAEKMFAKYPIHPIELIKALYDKKEWRKLFELAFDYGFTAERDYLLKAQYDELEAAFINSLWSNPISENKTIYKDILAKNAKLLGLKVHKQNSYYSYRNTTPVTFDSILQELATKKQEILNEIKLQEGYHKSTDDLTKEYFLEQLNNGAFETVIIKLCVKLEGILKAKYHLEGEFAEMLKKYCDSHLNWKEDDGWGYMVDRCDSKTIKLLNNLRIRRNSLVHSEEQSVELSLEDLKYCIDNICKLG